VIARASVPGVAAAELPAATSGANAVITSEAMPGDDVRGTDASGA